MTRPDVCVEAVEVAAATVPPDQPKADGTLSWDATTIVVMLAHGGGQRDVGYSDADASAAGLGLELKPAASDRYTE